MYFSPIKYVLLSPSLTHDGSTLLRMKITPIGPVWGGLP